MIHEFQHVADELRHRYLRLKEDAIHRALIRAEGEIPSPSEMAQNGMFIHVVQGSDSYEEFRWKNRPYFRIRIRFDEFKVWVLVNDL